MRARCISPCVFFVALFAFVPQALAEEPGVHVDPDSPSAKEYAIPLDRARSDAGGSPGSARSQQSPRFGAGIEPSSSSAAGADDAGSNHNESSQGSSGSGKGKKKVGDNASAGISSPVASAAGDSGSPALRLGRVALAVLAVGGLLGLALRRSLRARA